MYIDVTFIYISGLILVGFGQEDSLLQLAKKPLNLQVDVIQRSKSTSCGEAVTIMTYNYAYPWTPISEREVIDYAVAQGYFTDHRYNGKSRVGRRWRRLERLAEYGDPAGSR